MFPVAALMARARRASSHLRAEHQNPETVNIAPRRRARSSNNSLESKDMCSTADRSGVPSAAFCLF